MPRISSQCVVTWSVVLTTCPGALRYFQECTMDSPEKRNNIICCVRACCPSHLWLVWTFSWDWKVERQSCFHYPTGHDQSRLRTFGELYLKLKGLCSIISTPAGGEEGPHNATLLSVPVGEYLPPSVPGILICPSPAKTVLSSIHWWLRIKLNSWFCC